MKLNQLSQTEVDEGFNTLLSEKASTKTYSGKIVKPIGIRPEEFTEEYIEHLKEIREDDPETFYKIMHGL
jgi:hypothetical protein